MQRIIHHILTSDYEIGGCIDNGKFIQAQNGRFEQQTHFRVNGCPVLWHTHVRNPFPSGQDLAQFAIARNNTTFMIINEYGIFALKCSKLLRANVTDKLVEYFNNQAFMARYQIVVNNKDIDYVVKSYIKHVKRVFPPLLGFDIIFSKHNNHVDEELRRSFVDSRRKYLQEKYDEGYYNIVENKTTQLRQGLINYKYGLKDKPINEVRCYWDYFRATKNPTDDNIDRAVSIFNPKMMNETYEVKYKFLNDFVYNFERTDEHVL